jgi:hypothetical protein
LTICQRAGELIAQMGKDGTRDVGKGGDRKSQSRPTTVKLADLGISRDQSSQWQQLAGIDPKEVEKELPMRTGKGPFALP